jgi:hypothetical protein
VRNVNTLRLGDLVRRRSGSDRTARVVEPDGRGTIYATVRWEGSRRRSTIRACDLVLVERDGKSVVESAATGGEE